MIVYKLILLLGFATTLSILSITVAPKSNAEKVIFKNARYNAPLKIKVQKMPSLAAYYGEKN